MIYLLYLFCFLIISCDLPSEANQDCNGDTGGSALLDDCGICSGGETGYLYNSDIDCCGECFGTHLDCDTPCYKCGDDKAINSSDCTFDFNVECENELETCCEGNEVGCSNSCDYIFQHDDSICVYDLCTDYFTHNDTFDCQTSGSSPYQLGEQLSCETLQTEFDICYPQDCGSVKLADFEGRNILIIYEFDW